MTGDRLTVGVVTPHAAAGPEVELPAMTRGRLATVVSLVLEANQALLWAILAATGTPWDVTGHGRLLQARTSTK